MSRTSPINHRRVSGVARVAASEESVRNGGRSGAHGRPSIWLSNLGRPGAWRGEGNLLRRAFFFQGSSAKQAAKKNQKDLNHEPTIDD